jgi:hypothetical protein
MLVSLMHLITVSQAMILASSTKSIWNSIFRNTAGIVFVGTPHRGSSSAEEAAVCFHLIPFVHTPPLIRLLCKNSSLLVQIAEQFGNIWGSRRIFSFCETKPTVGLRKVIHHSAFLRHFSHQLLLFRLSPGKKQPHIVKESTYTQSKIAITLRYPSLNLLRATFSQSFSMQ